MVKIRILLMAMVAAGAMGFGLGIELGRQSRSTEQPAMVAPIPSPLNSIVSPSDGQAIPDDKVPRWRTIYVPLFKSAVEGESLVSGPGMASELTRAVVRGIELKTPYKVVGTSDADTKLTGTITNFSKQYPPNYMAYRSEIREPETHLMVEVTWRDLRTDESLLPQQGGSTPVVTVVKSVAYFRPEIGETIDSARKQNVELLAEQIVSLLETRW